VAHLSGSQSRKVQTHIAWLEQQAVPDLCLSLHEDWESTGFYYYEINIASGGLTYEQVIAAAGKVFPPEPELVIDDHEVTRPGWIFHESEPDIPEGWPEAIWFAKRGCPLSLTLETPSSQDLEKRIQCHQEVIRLAIDELKKTEQV